MPEKNRPGDPPLPEYSEDGVDLSLIRWMLSLTPAERLQFVQNQTNRILAIRELNTGGPHHEHRAISDGP
jgi:hypothetical protein